MYIEIKLHRIIFNLIKVYNNYNYNNIIIIKLIQYTNKKRKVGTFNGVN